MVYFKRIKTNGLLAAMGRNILSLKKTKTWNQSQTRYFKSPKIRKSNRFSVYFLKEAMANKSERSFSPMNSMPQSLSAKIYENNIQRGIFLRLVQQCTALRFTSTKDLTNNEKESISCLFNSWFWMFLYLWVEVVISLRQIKTWEKKWRKYFYFSLCFIFKSN